MPELPAARWAADPYGRHEMRYWDGVAWTAHVSDHGVTSSDMVPGVAAGQAAASGAPMSLDGPADSDQTVVMPAPAFAVAGAASAATTVMPAAPVGAGLPLPADPGVDAFFASSGVAAEPVPPPVYRAAPSGKPRTGLIVGIASLGIVGVIAGVIGFSGLPDGGKKGGSDGVVPVAAPPTSSAATDVTGPPTSDDPVASTSTKTYGGPTTSPVARTTTKVRATTTKPRTSTSTTPKVTVTKPTPTVTLPTRPGLRQYASCPAMHVDHPHGVGRPGARDRTDRGGPRVRNFEVNAALYFINSRLDFDGDGIACEA